MDTYTKNRVNPCNPCLTLPTPTFFFKHPNEMKQSRITYPLCLFFALCLSCGESQHEVPAPPEKPEASTIIEGINPIVNPNAAFAEDDGAITYDSPAKLVADLLTKAGPEIIKGLGYIHISEKEYKEIKEFTDQTTTLTRYSRTDKEYAKVMPTCFQ